ncbi:hypothetical protein C2S51_029175 [Perilla frutescens var. frutescens]|nr:hypothetical protein C2S51_029175 [Perilla frutescens var. frutescens]
MVTSTPTDLLPVTTMMNMVQIKLDTSTYLMWRRQVIHMAECFDLMPFLDGTATVPRPTVTTDAGVTSPNPAYLTWRMKDRKLLSVISASLTVESMLEVIDCNTSHTTWVALESVYAHSSASRTHQLREELLSLHHGDASVDDYSRKFKIICDQLAAISQPVHESDKSHWFLRGLGLSFAGFADTRMAISPMSEFRDFLHQARQYEIMLQSMEGRVTPAAAFTADHGQPHSFSRNTNSGQSNSGGNHSTNTQTDGCQRMGNKRGPGSGGRGNSSRYPQGRRPPRCQICRGEHYVDKCPRFLNASHASHSAQLAQAFNDFLDDEGLIQHDIYYTRQSNDQILTFQTRLHKINSTWKLS